MAFDEALADRVREILAVRPADADLAKWVEVGVDYAASLPPKR